MTRIETVAEIGPDRKLVIDLPEEVSPGRRHIVLMVLEDDDAKSDPSEVSLVGALEREGELLVFNGPVPSDLDIRRLIERDRDERMLSVLFGDGE